MTTIHPKIPKEQLDRLIAFHDRHRDTSSFARITAIRKDCNRIWRKFEIIRKYLNQQQFFKVVWTCQFDGLDYTYKNIYLNF